MMNNNCQEYDFSMESLILRCNKPFALLFKEYTHNVPFNQLLNKRHVDMNYTFQAIGLLQSCLVSLILTPFALSG